MALPGAVEVKVVVKAVEARVAVRAVEVPRDQEEDHSPAVVDRAATVVDRAGAMANVVLQPWIRNNAGV